MARSLPPACVGFARRAVLTAILLAPIFLAPPARAKEKDSRLKWDKSWGPMVPHKKFPKDCSICHVAKRWDVLRSDFSFDHLKETGYPLIGAHANAACLRCHNDRGAVKAYASRGCSGCHVDPHKGTLGLDCAHCHDQTVWVLPGQQGQKIADHARTRFPLTGMHAVVECRQCHLTADQGVFNAMPIDCWSCHKREFSSAPNHVAQNYSYNCQNCHQTSAFAGAIFNHSSLPNPVCITCHQNDFNRAPSHVAQNYSTACQTCHQTATWQGAGFNHSQLGANPNCFSCHASNFTAANATPASKHAANGFPQTCANCHNTSVFGPGTTMQHSFVSATPCYNCHAADYAGALNHVAQNFPTTCASCHTGTASWTATFDHAPLGPNPVCWTCHQTDYAGAKSTPASNHAALGFPQTCQNCHNFAAWGPGTAMQHSFVSATPCYNCHTADFASANKTPASKHAANGFPQTCANCHTTSVFGPGTAMQHSFVSATPCYNCHTADFASANVTPASKHAANGFPQTCANCHTTTLFGPGTLMQHSFVSATPCYNCHTADYTSAPNHIAQNFPTTCLSCHSGTATWLGALFDHTALGANPVCWTCHQTEYAGAKKTPASNHPGNGFPQTCQNCHTFAAWGPGTAMQHSFVTATPCYTCHTADFAGAKATPASNHAANAFPTTCQNCHNTNVWGPGTAMVHSAAGVPAACQTCHTADFNSATSPLNHPSQVFIAACNTCHSNTTTWTSAFTHSPSNCYTTPATATHHGATCMNCHTTPVYTTATCTACHSNRALNSCGN